MKHPDQTSKCVLITHLVNPHQFYYKEVDHIVNGEFSKFDFEIQLYGNELYPKKTHENGYVPVENELVIFYNLIFNKWIRGRVISIGQDITFWCIDNGIWEKLVAPHILPLTKRLHEDMKIVHLGGLSLLPTEKTLNVETVEVENRLSREWDKKSIDLFKRIISTSKTILFTEQFALDNHKFGLLAIESKTGNKKEINQILLEMNNAAHSHQYSEDDLWLYVHEAQLQAQLRKSVLDGSSIRTLDVNVDPTKTSVHRSFLKYGSEMSSAENLSPNDYFDDSVSRQSSSDISAILEPTICHREHERCPPEVKPKTEERREYPHIQAEQLIGAGDDDLAMGDTSPPTKIDCTESNLKFLTEESHLRVCKSYFTENVRPQPLRSTMNWINSMGKSNTSVKTSRSSLVNLKDGHQSCQPPQTSSSTKNVPVTSATSRRKILADLAKKMSASDSTVKKSASVANPRFGVPAGYAKNCLDTFGGLNTR